VFEILCKNLSINFFNLNNNYLIFKPQNINYISSPKLKALNNINIEIKENERVGLLGKNGSGKTTFLRTLAGVYHLSSGILKVNSPTTSFLNIGVGLDENATGYENIPLLMAAREIPFELYNDVVLDVENFSELADALNRPVRTYSQGMKLRIAFTVATHILSNKILLMDEIIAFGDVHFKKKSTERLLDHMNNCKVLVLASHSSGLLKTHCERGIVFDKGEVIFDGNIDDAINFNSK
jgi:ABC-type polysaccharide/polyol phosphate transport system ATPase subunit